VTGGESTSGPGIDLGLLLPIVAWGLLIAGGLTVMGIYVGTRRRRRLAREREMAMRVRTALETQLKRDPLSGSAG
jgi:uncharacterized membrane protein